MPTRGATFAYVVLYGDVPGGARERSDKSFRLYPVTAGMAGPLIVVGTKSRSHRSPYVKVKRGVTRQVSCANAPRLCNANETSVPEKTKPPPVKSPLSAEGT